jgi:squalene-hopene/tetraprenyl-beta-curcumene cyclase
MNKALKLACERLIAETAPDGSWRGYLSGSAVSTAVAAFALARLRNEAHAEIQIACEWLAANINDDNGWGDTPESPSNLTATLLTKAALTTQQNSAAIDNVQLRSDQWLTEHIGGISAEHITTGVLQTYGKDRTFSAPILTMCAMAGMLGSEPECWKLVPRLPFEIAALPRGMFRLMNLSVVSYAIPALIAVGLVRFRKTTSCWCNFIHNRLIIPIALRRLKRMAPESGGFLEAAPLTGFVAMCLGEAGLTASPVAQKALDFLQTSIRKDGSWPIDTDLSTWLTSLGSRALVDADVLSNKKRHALAEIIRSRQTKKIHPFTGAKPGGWGWTDFSGSVPDGDDTAAALIALALLEPNRVTDEVIAGLEWLLKLMNRDGGMPTFCRGWGLLPFDRSCPDISAHAFKAFLLWRNHVPPKLTAKLNIAMQRLLNFLNKSRDADQVWTPLWFGDQGAHPQTNRVYGTSVVLENLAEYSGIDELTAPALDWLVKARNDDGGWGGEPGSPSIFETTAKAIGALSLYPQTRELAIEAAEVLTSIIIKDDGIIKSSPIGLYFASLWYDERLYPLLFAIPALARTSSTAIKR